MLQVRAMKPIFRHNAVQIFIDEKRDGRLFTAEPIKMREIRDDEIYNVDAPGDGVMINGEAAQQLIDDLWQCGLRPSEGAGSAGSLAATQRHLSDMRKLVEKSLKVELQETGK